VATVTLNRPELHNAFDDDLMRALTARFRALAADANVRVIVLAAAGKSFSAGADLAWMKRMAGYSYAENLADAGLLGDMLEAIHAAPMPVVARVQGAVGAALVCGRLRHRARPGELLPQRSRRALCRRSAPTWCSASDRRRAVTRSRPSASPPPPRSAWACSRRLPTRRRWIESGTRARSLNGPAALAACKALYDAVAAAPAAHR
jgi:hypothetical protein